MSYMLPSLDICKHCQGLSNDCSRLYGELGVCCCSAFFRLHKQWLTCCCALDALSLQITSQFNDKDPASGEKELDADLAQKARYSVWRAAEIRKALKEGRPPVPPSSDLFIPAGGAGDGAAEGGLGTGAAAADRDPFAGPAYDQGDHGDFPDPGPSVSSNRQMPGGSDSASHYFPSKSRLMFAGIACISVF